MSNKFHWGVLTIIVLLIFAGIALKLENIGPTVNPYLSGPSVFNKRKETVSLPKYSIK